MVLSHPRVTIPPETKFYGMIRDTNRGLDLTTDRGFTKACETAWANLNRRGIGFDRDRFMELASAADRSWPGVFTAVLAAYSQQRDADRVGEKSPVHTHYAHEIMSDFPEAKFVHVLRDPRAVVLSRIKAGFGTRLIGPNIVRWRRAVDMHERIADTLGPERYHIVRYESLVQDREGTLRALCAFLDLEFMPEMLEHQDRKDRGWSDRSKDWLKNTLKPVFTSSIDAWKNDLKPAQIALIEAGLGDRIELMGYERSGATTWAPGPRLALSVVLGHVEECYRKGVRGLRKLFRRPNSEQTEQDPA